MPVKPPPMPEVQRLIDLALAEDGFDRDVTSAVAIAPARDAPHAARSTAPFIVVAREPGVFAGAAVLEAFAERFAGRVTVRPRASDGGAFDAGRCLAELSGDRTTILGVERTLLNFLQRLCGVATLTRRFVDAARGLVRIVDTRKTIPAWRALDKYAVRCGGGHNHRMGLHDAVLVKDNHLASIPLERLVDEVAAMVRRAAAMTPPPEFIEIEVDRLDQFRAILSVPGVNVILLDNFAIADLREAVRLRDAAGLRGRVELEVSGGVRLEAVGDIAGTGVDRIAVGAITHSAPAVDLALDQAAGQAG